MNRSIKSLLVVVIFIFTLSFLAGCSDDLRNRNLFDGGAGDAVIRFSIEDVVLTRDGEAYNMETIVDHAYLLFYDASASLETASPVSAVRGEVDSDHPGRLQFKMPLQLEPNKDYQLIAVANADDYTPSGFNSFKEYLESWCNNSSGSIENPLQLFCSSFISRENHENLPMNSGLTGDTKFRFSIENGNYNVNATLSFRRMVARIDVANIVKEGFIIEGVALCNWRDAVSVTSLDSKIGNRLGNVGGILSEATGSTDDIFVEMPNRDDSGNQQLTESLYCFPSVAYDAYSEDQESTALILKAKYGNDSHSSYYRVNVGMTGNRSEVKANTKYLIVVQSVKGSGAPTPQEAYASSDSPIVLSVVEDWDLEDGHFAMDENGNFIIVSKGSPIEFGQDATDNVLIRVLTSKGLDWSAEYIADNSASADAFNVQKISDTAVSIGPTGENVDEEPLSGVCRVFANTRQGSTLELTIPLSQEAADEKPYVPEEPTNLPFALIPTSGDRVKIDHEKLTIEIDGFDPDCFNSFIDVPFKVYVNESFNVKRELSLHTDLDWPLEGGITKSVKEDYYYCSNSFSTDLSTGFRVYSKNRNKELKNSETVCYYKDFDVLEGEIVHILIGAMAPDDPAIQKTISLYDDTEIKTIEYKLEIKPRPAIIDDVILTDSDGKSWLIIDRNLQDISKFSEFASRMPDGRKWQAYNYLVQGYPIHIPNKLDMQNAPFTEAFHELSKGKEVSYKNISTLQSKSDGSSSDIVKDWLAGYRYADSQDKSSPFYDTSNIELWTFPSKEIITLCAAKMHVSKMRMYLVSDIAVKSGRKSIPICCYLPYQGYQMGQIVESEGVPYGYYYAEESETPQSMMFVYHDNTEMKTSEPSSSSLKNYSGLVRLVRPLSGKELDDYKKGYLGYGAVGHKLTICHPDTYTSEGWINW